MSYRAELGLKWKIIFCRLQCCDFSTLILDRFNEKSANLGKFDDLWRFRAKTAYLPHEFNTFYQKIKQNFFNTSITFILQLIPTFQLISLRFYWRFNRMCHCKQCKTPILGHKFAKFQLIALAKLLYTKFSDFLR